LVFVDRRNRMEPLGTPKLNEVGCFLLGGGLCFVDACFISILQKHIYKDCMEKPRLWHEDQNTVSSFISCSLPRPAVSQKSAHGFGS
jgi:hypothetical protein